MKRSNKRFLTCPWCKEKMVTKTTSPYGEEILKCENCDSWCSSIFVYIRKRIKHFFD